MLGFITPSYLKGPIQGTQKFSSFLEKTEGKLKRMQSVLEKLKKIPSGLNTYLKEKRRQRREKAIGKCSKNEFEGCL